MIKVLIADDQRLLRDALVNLINIDEEITVVDDVDDGKKAIDSCFKYLPDIVILDIKMPNLNGIEATKIIKKKYPTIKILMLTTIDDRQSIIESFISGADGYVVKDIDSNSLISSIKLMYNGIHIVHPSVHRVMAQEFKMLIEKNKECTNKNDYDLSDVETDIIKCLVKGKNNKDIGEILGFAEGTIKNRVSKLYDKLSLNDRTQLAVFAIENKLI